MKKRYSMLIFCVVLVTAAFVLTGCKCGAGRKTCGSKAKTCQMKTATGGNTKMACADCAAAGQTCAKCAQKA